MEPRSITIPYHNIANRLLTECGICQAYIPNPNIPHPKVVTFRALWDTGATCSTISPKVAEILGLRHYRFVNVFHAQGESQTKLYKVNILLPNNVGFPVMTVLEGNLHDFDVLIGMDIISRGDFVITNRGGKTLFSFQIPSTHEYDFVKQNQHKVGQSKTKKKR